MIKKDVQKQITKIRKLLPSKNAKILNITHKGCMDGCGSQIILSNVFHNLESVECTYNDIDKTISNINFDNYDCIILTDIAPEHDDGVFNLSNKIILIDHHETAQRFYDPEKLKFVYNGECGSLLTKKFLEEVFSIDLSYLNDFVTLLNDYDMWHLKDVRSKQLSILFYSIWNDKFRRRFNSGNTKFTDEELKLFKQKEYEFNEMYNNLDFFEFDSINACLVTAGNFINDICHKALTEENFNIIFVRNPNSKNISIRTNIKDFNIGKFIFKLGFGGGHAQSAGMKENDLEKLNKILKDIEKQLYIELPLIRKR